MGNSSPKQSPGPAAAKSPGKAKRPGPRGAAAAAASESDLPPSFSPISARRSLRKAPSPSGSSDSGSGSSTLLAKSSSAPASPQLKAPRNLELENQQLKAQLLEKDFIILKTRLQAFYVVFAPERLGPEFQVKLEEAVRYGLAKGEKRLNELLRAQYHNDLSYLEVAHTRGPYLGLPISDMAPSRRDGTASPRNAQRAHSSAGSSGAGAAAAAARRKMSKELSFAHVELSDDGTDDGVDETLVKIELRPSGDVLRVLLKQVNLQAILRAASEALGSDVNIEICHELGDGGLLPLSTDHELDALIKIAEQSDSNLKVIAVVGGASASATRVAQSTEESHHDWHKRASGQSAASGGSQASGVSNLTSVAGALSIRTMEGLV